MTVVIDTNVMLTARAVRHRNYVLLRALLAGQFELAASTAIMLEYQEIITKRASAEDWGELTALFDIADELHGNLLHVEPSFRFHLIIADPDDDKFADCAIAAEADFIITEDTHFETLRGSGHQPQPVTPGEFIARHLSVA